MNVDTLPDQATSLVVDVVKHPQPKRQPALSQRFCRGAAMNVDTLPDQATSLVVDVVNITAKATAGIIAKDFAEVLR